VIREWQVLVRGRRIDGASAPVTVLVTAEGQYGADRQAVAICRQFFEEIESTTTAPVLSGILPFGPPTITEERV
jgi:hypothetical protein